MKLLSCIFLFLLTSIRNHPSYFGFEQINAYFNNKKIGHWSPVQKNPKNLIVDFQSPNDTLLFTGYCDCGCLDGTVIHIRDKNENIVSRITRRSSTMHDDTLVYDASTPGKLVFRPDHGIVFKVTMQNFRQLKKGETYSLFLSSVLDKSAADRHIFNLQAE